MKKKKNQTPRSYISCRSINLRLVDFTLYDFVVLVLQGLSDYILVGNSRVYWFPGP